jgi:hypothetical protein
MAAGQKRGNGKPGFGLGGGNGERRGRKGLKRRSVNKPKGGDGALGGGHRFGFRFKGREGIATTVRQVDRGVTATTMGRRRLAIRRGELSRAHG